MKVLVDRNESSWQTKKLYNTPVFPGPPRTYPGCLTWEVLVRVESQWDLKVCKESTNRERKISLSSGPRMWTVRPCITSCAPGSHAVWPSTYAGGGFCWVWERFRFPSACHGPYNLNFTIDSTSESTYLTWASRRWGKFAFLGSAPKRIQILDTLTPTPDPQRREIILHKECMWKGSIEWLWLRAVFSYVLILS